MKRKIGPKPKEGDIRFVRRFAWLPFTGTEGGVTYRVWLETYTSHQVYAPTTPTLALFDTAVTKYHWVEFDRSLLWPCYT